MNTKKIIAAVAVFAAAGSAFAQQTYPYVDFGGFQSTKTRAEVIAELKQARDNGTYVVAGQEFVDPAAKFVSTKTRAQVLAELKQAQEDGTYVAGGQEFNSQFPAATQHARGHAKTNALVHGGKAVSGTTNN